jgi:hypothetical protein
VPSPSRRTRFTENVLRERDGEAATRPPLLVAANFVAAARSWGVQLFVLYRTKLSHCRGTSALDDGVEAFGFEVVARICGGLCVGVRVGLQAYTVDSSTCPSRTRDGRYKGHNRAHAHLKVGATKAKTEFSHRLVATNLNAVVLVNAGCPMH